MIDIKEVVSLKKRITKLERRLVALFLVMLFVLTLGGQGINWVQAASTGPTIITYQGRILDTADVPISDASIDVEIALYDAASGGNCLYSLANDDADTSTIDCGGNEPDDAYTVTLADGLFTVYLGDTSVGPNTFNLIPESVFQDNAAVYIDIEIDGDQLSPRKRVSSAPYAVNASYLDGYDWSDQLTMTGDPSGTGVGQGSVYINPAAPGAGETILGIADNGTQVFKVDEGGNVVVGSGSPAILGNGEDLFVTSSVEIAGGGLVYGELATSGTTAVTFALDHTTGLTGAAFSTDTNTRDIGFSAGFESDVDSAGSYEFYGGYISALYSGDDADATTNIKGLSVLAQLDETAGTSDIDELVGNEATVDVADGSVAEIFGNRIIVYDSDAVNNSSTTTAYGVYSQVSGTNFTSLTTAYGGYFTASGATTNIGLYASTSTADADTIQLNNSGDSELMSIKVGDTTPAATISAHAGSLYLQDDNSTGMMWLNTTGGGAAGTTWEQVITSGSSLFNITLDDAYNNDAGERTITVDDGAVSWDLSAGNDFIVDSQNVGSVFTVQSSGTDVFVVDGNKNITFTTANGAVTSPFTINGNAFTGVAATALLDIGSTSITDGTAIDINLNNSGFAGTGLNIVSDDASASGDLIALQQDGTGDSITIDHNGESTSSQALYIDQDWTTAAVTSSYDANIIDVDIDADMSGGTFTFQALDIDMAMNGDTVFRGGNIHGLDVSASYSGANWSNEIIGGRFTADNTTSAVAVSNVYGIYATAQETSGATQNSYGGLFISSNAGTNYGIAAQVNGSGNNTGISSIVSSADSLAYGMQISSISSAASAVYGINLSATGNGGLVYGINSTVNSNSGSNAIYGIRSVIQADTGTGTNYGMYSYMNGAYANDSYGVYIVHNDTGGNSGAGILIDENQDDVALSIDSEASGSPLIDLAPLAALSRGAIALGATMDGDPGSTVEGDLWYDINGVSDGQLCFDDGTASPVCVNSGNLGGAVNFDEVYAQSILDTDLNMEIDNATGLAFDLTTTGDFVIEDNGTAFASFYNDGTTVFNETGVATYDLRVESDTNANMLFVDAGDDEVGIGTNAPVSFFHISSPDTGDVMTLSANSVTTGNAFSVNVADLTSGNGMYMYRADDADIFTGHMISINQANDNTTSTGDGLLSTMLGAGDAIEGSKTTPVTTGTSRTIIGTHNSSQTLTGSSFLYGTVGASNFTGDTDDSFVQLQGIRGEATFSGTAGTAEEDVYGSTGYANMSSAGETVNISAGAFGRSSASNGTISSAYGVYGEVYPYSSGAITTGYGVYGYAREVTDAMTTGYGGYFRADNATTNYGMYAQATTAATTNYGIYATASGATNNYAGIFANGNVGIGDTTPDDATLKVSSSASGDYVIYVDAQGGVDTNALQIDNAGSAIGLAINNSAGTYGMYVNQQTNNSAILVQSTATDQPTLDLSSQNTSSSVISVVNAPGGASTAYGIHVNFSGDSDNDGQPIYITPEAGSPVGQIHLGTGQNTATSAAESDIWYDDNDEQFCVRDSDSTFCLDDAGFVGASSIWTDGGTYVYPTNYESARVYDSGGTDYIDFSHNGTDAIIQAFQAAELVINEDGSDIDFRIESNTNANMFTVNAGEDSIGINSAGSATADITIIGEHNNILDIDQAYSNDVATINGIDLDISQAGAQTDPLVMAGEDISVTFSGDSALLDYVQMRGVNSVLNVTTIDATSGVEAVSLRGISQMTGSGTLTSAGTLGDLYGVAGAAWLSAGTVGGELVGTYSEAKIEGASATLDSGGNGMMGAFNVARVEDDRTAHLVYGSVNSVDWSSTANSATSDVYANWSYISHSSGANLDRIVGISAAAAETGAATVNYAVGGLFSASGASENYSIFATGAAVHIDDSTVDAATTATYALSAGELFIEGDVETDGNIYLDDYLYFNEAATEYFQWDNGNSQFVITDDLVPSADDTYDLGSSTARWQDIYLGPSTLHIGADSDESQISYTTASDLLTFQNSVDSITAFQFLDANGGTPILNIDGTNERVGIGTASPVGILSVENASDSVYSYYVQNTGDAGMFYLDHNASLATGMLVSQTVTLDNATNLSGGSLNQFTTYSTNTYSGDTGTNGLTLIDHYITSDFSGVGGSGFEVVGGLFSTAKYTKNSGTADLIFGVFGDATSVTAGGTASSAYGVIGAIGDSGSAGSITTAYGVYGGPNPNGPPIGDNITTAYGGYFDVTSMGASNNYAGAFIGGNVGVGTATPAALLEVENSGSTAGLLVDQNSDYSAISIDHDTVDASALSIDTLMTTSSTSAIGLDLTHASSTNATSANLALSGIDANTIYTGSKATYDITITGANVQGLYRPSASSINNGDVIGTYSNATLSTQSSADNIASAVGVRATTNLTSDGGAGGGAIADAYGIYTEVLSDTGSIANARAMYANVLSSGAISNAYGLVVDLDSGTNKTGLQIDLGEDSAGTTEKFLSLVTDNDNVDIYTGTTAPNFIAEGGSLYLLDDGNGSGTSGLYINITSSDTANAWAQVATTASGTTLQNAYDASGAPALISMSTSKNLGFVTNDTGGSESNFVVRDTGFSFFVQTDTANNDLLLGDSTNNEVKPGTDNAVSLGSDAIRWSALYVEGASLHVGDAVNDEGVISYDGSNVKISNTNSSPNDIIFNTGGSDRVVIDDKGRLGINNPTPAAKLDMVDAINMNAITGGKYSVFIDSTANAGTAGTNAQYNGMRVDTSGSYTSGAGVDLIRGLFLNTDWSGTTGGTGMNEVYGVYNNVQTTNNADADDISASFNWAINQSGSTVNDMYGGEFYADNYGTATNVYGAFVSATDSNAATNAFGIYTQVSGATNNYGAAFMGGNVGIMEATPDFALDVNGNIGLGTGGTGSIHLNDDVSDNTNITFNEDRIRIFTGGVEMIDIAEAATNQIIVNNTGADVNYRIESDNNEYMFNLDAGADEIGIGRAIPIGTLRADLWVGTGDKAEVIDIYAGWTDDTFDEEYGINVDLNHSGDIDATDVTITSAYYSNDFTASATGGGDILLVGPDSLVDFGSASTVTGYMIGSRSIADMSGSGTLDTIILTVNGDVYGSASQAKLSGSGTVEGEMVGAYNEAVQEAGSATSSEGIMGAYNVANVSGAANAAGSADLVVGAYNRGRYTAAVTDGSEQIKGSVNQAYFEALSANGTASQTIDQLVGAENNATVTGPNNDASHTFSTLYGTRSTVVTDTSNTSTITDTYGVYATSVRTGSSTVTNSYGLYASATGASNNYSLYGGAGLVQIEGDATATTPTFTQVSAGGDVFIRNDVELYDGSLCVGDGATDDCSDAAGVDGAIYAVGGSFNSHDVAEEFVSDDALNPGELVIADITNAEQVRLSDGTVYDHRIVGVVSTDPGVTLGWISPGETDAYAIALVGRTPVKVSNENGTVQIGDWLTSSSTPGYVMKATQPGPVVGKALENQTVALDEIVAYISIGWSAGESISNNGTAVVIDDETMMNSLGVATSGAPAYDSNTLAFRGSAWTGVEAEARDMKLSNVVTDSTDYRLSVTDTADAEVAYVSSEGNLAIAGRLYPSDRGTLQEDKYIYYDGSAGLGGDMMRTNASGWATGSYDFAEMFPSSQYLEAGEVVSIDPADPEHIKRSFEPYDGMIVGVISTKPGFLAGDNNPNEYPVALAGRVPVLVSTENGPIASGDPLTSSNTTGVAMKATEPGRIIGYALGDYSGAGIGTVVVFVEAGWWGGSSEPAEGGSSGGGSASGDATLDSLTMYGNIYMMSNNIVGISQLAGISNRWTVNEEGVFETAGSYDVTIESYQGEDVETHAVLSTEHKITLSGTGQLSNGQVTIEFDEANQQFNDIISTVEDYRVLVTLTEEANGIYVTDKTNSGFKVMELNGGSSDATFDWYVEAYRKDYEPSAAVCGNTIIEAGEECDDGNTADGDGCSTMCLEEVEEDPACGNGTLEDEEQCDDGNTNDGDGCSAMCVIEEEPPVEAICGDGVTEGTEECDDGNTDDGDGCSAMCLIEVPPEPEPVCGDSVQEGTEECDDGNTADGDGCSAMCVVEEEPPVEEPPVEELPVVPPSE